MQKVNFFQILLSLIFCAVSSRAQTTTYVVDAFNPAGIGANVYSSGQITNVWGNWFGGAFQSLAWDSANDASNNPDSGSLKISANFTASSSLNQFEVFDGYSGISPPLTGLQYTNFQCDVRFAAGSAVTTNGSLVSFGHLQFGVVSNGTGQDYFGSVDVAATNTGWVHVSLPINAVADTNLTQINDVLIHIYGPFYSGGLAGNSTLWIDNIQFLGSTAPTSGVCTVDWSKVYQRIDGFGASSAWNGSLNSTQADMFFSTNSGAATSYDGRTNFAFSGIGLSLLRSRIAPGGSTVENGIMQLAQARGARVWSAPWSPQTSFKSANLNGVISVNGGAFVGNSANYQAYASQLAGYVANMKNAYGVNLYALSIQNEPDVNTTNYESCIWTAQQFHDFVPYLSSALAASNAAMTKIILPEDENWQTNYFLTAMSDAATATNVGIVACHDYDGSPPTGTPAALSTYANTNAALWETEVSILSGSDSSMANALYWAGRVHLFMTAANANAWHYWWLVPGNSVGNQGLTDTNGVPAKRMYALGNFSRFVRPNFYRIGVSNAVSLNAPQISAYKDSTSPNFAIVAINANTTAFEQTFNLTNLAGVSTLTPWITSSNLSLVSQTAVAVTNLSFTYALPAMSVVTFTGQLRSPPVLSAVPNQTINAGVTLTITNIVTDTNLPAPALTFALAFAPTNATLNSANGIFVWRPLLSQANSTNMVMVTVADNGTPVLSATNSFSVIVKPVISPTINAVNVTGGHVSLNITGMQGPDYSLLASTNLSNWQVIQTSNSPVLPLILNDANFGNFPARFYRIQIGP